MSEISIWRTTIAPGEATYIWSRTGHLPAGKGGAPLGGNTFTLDDSVHLSQFNWAQTLMWTDSTFATGLRVSPQSPPGIYHLHIRGVDTQVAITIEPRPASRPFVNIVPTGGPDSAAIAAALNDGKSAQLTAGVYTIDSTISVPTGAAIRGAHRDATILKRVPREADYQNRFFTSVGDYFTLSDLTAEGGFANEPLLFHNHPGPNKGVVMQRLRLRNMGSVVGNMPGALVEDVEFINSGGPVGGTQQLWKDISFTGIGPNANESIAQGDQFALINATWRDTGRGLILRNGPTNSYFNSLSFSGIDRIINGNEVILVEDTAGPGLQNSIFSHVSIRNCSGSVTFFKTPAGNNLFRSVRIEGGGGIVFVPGNSRQADNLFDGLELRGCAGVHLGGATGNTFQGLAIISPRPTWNNQGGYMPDYYSRSAAITGSEGNFFNPFTIQDLPDGWKEMD